MGLNNAIATFGCDPLLPLYAEGDCCEQVTVVNLAPSTTFARGTVLGVITSAANEVWTISDSATVSGGTYTISGTNPLTGASFVTAAIAYNANNAAIKAALELVLGSGITVTPAGSGMPTNDTTLTFSGTAAGIPICTPVLTGSVTGGGSLAIARTTIGRSANTAGAYANGNSDGTETAKYLLKYACATDAAGNITFGGQSGADVAGVSSKTAPVYYGGVFKTSELVGLDANGVTDLNGVLLQGTATDGVLKF
jgi:hypothetical protein